MSYSGPERRSLLSRFLDNEGLVLLVLGLLSVVAGLAGAIVLNLQ